MARNHIEKIRCPKCAEESDFTVWDSINTSLEPEMKAKVRSGGAFLHICPKCGSRTRIDYPVLYHQMEDQVMINYVRPADVKQASEMMRGIYKDNDGRRIDLDMKLDVEYIRRVVCTMNQFREKLLILDEGLDDRVIELMKLFMLVRLKERDADTDIREFLFIKNEGKRCFAFCVGEDKWGQTAYSQAMYDQFTAQFAERLKRDRKVVVDMDWAARTVQKVQQ